MAKKVAQSVVNQKCQLLESQREEVTINKVKRLIGGDISIVDLAEKVTLYKESPKKAVEVATTEVVAEDIHKDEILEVLKQGLSSFKIDNHDLLVCLRNSLNKVIQNHVALETQKLKQKTAKFQNKNESLEISNLILNRQYQELLEKYNKIKDDNYNLKQNVQTRVTKELEQDAIESALLKREDFKSPQQQLKMLERQANKVAVYDKGRVIIKFPATDPLTQQCRQGSSRYLQAKTEYMFELKCWALSEFADFFRTMDLLKRNRFIFSKELETIIYRLEQQAKNK